MVKAIRLMQEKANPAESEENLSSESETEEEDEDDIPLASLIAMDLLKEVPYRRLPCMAHTLQLVIKLVYKYPYFETVIKKVRQLVGHIKKSSVLMERLSKKCGISVIMDCMTRWNSTYSMTERFINLKEDINMVLADATVNNLVKSEWTKLDKLKLLLEPFSIQTIQFFKQIPILCHI